MGWTEVTLRVLEKALDAAALRHKLLANNIANADTPNYKRKDLAFKHELEKLLAGEQPRKAGRVRLVTTHHKHLGNGIGEFKPEIVETAEQTWRNDGNNVDVEREMSELAKNNLYYQVVANQIGKHLKILEKVISQAGQK